MSFICNIYDPELEDAIDHLVSAKADPSKKDILFKMVLDYINECSRGDPLPTKKHSVSFLKNHGIIGLYRTDNTSSSAINFLKTSINNKKIPDYNPAEAQDTEYNTHLGEYDLFSKD